MTADAHLELAALRQVLLEALSLARDSEVSPGARELRMKFSEAAMARLDALEPVWRPPTKDEQREET